MLAVTSLTPIAIDCPRMSGAGTRGFTAPPPPRLPATRASPQAGPAVDRPGSEPGDTDRPSRQVPSARVGSRGALPRPQIEHHVVEVDRRRRGLGVADLHPP